MKDGKIDKMNSVTFLAVTVDKWGKPHEHLHCPRCLKKVYSYEDQPPQHDAMYCRSWLAEEAETPSYPELMHHPARIKAKGNTDWFPRLGPVFAGKPVNRTVVWNHARSNWVEPAQPAAIWGQAPTSDCSLGAVPQQPWSSDWNENESDGVAIEGSGHG